MNWILNIEPILKKPQVAYGSPTNSSCWRLSLLTQRLVRYLWSVGAQRSTRFLPEDSPPWMWEAPKCSTQTLEIKDLCYFRAPSLVVSGCFPLFQSLSADSQIVGALVSGLDQSVGMSGMALCRSWLGRRPPLCSVVLPPFLPPASLWLVTWTSRSLWLIPLAWTLNWKYSAGIDILKENLISFFYFDSGHSSEHFLSTWCV